MAGPKLVLAVIDAMKPAMLERAIANGRAPALKSIVDRGALRDDCVAAFPSVTPVCAAQIATGTGPDEHGIPSMNWYLRSEGRYVEYGTSFKASQTFGIRQSMTDTVYNMNSEHLSSDVSTIFERLDDADFRTAGTTYLMYRGRHRHEVSQETALARIVTSTLFKNGVLGPRELFYADLFASRRTGCTSQLGKPGARDQHAGCVASYLVENDLFDFLLLSLPDNDTHSHRKGVFSQVTSIAEADRQIERMMHAAGGVDEFLAEHGIIVCSDHSQSQVERALDLHAGFEDWKILPASGEDKRDDAEIALCPGSRSAMVYVLDQDRRELLTQRAMATALRLDGVDLAMRLASGGQEAIVRSAQGEVRFQPGGDIIDQRGAHWAVAGDFGVLGLTADADGRITSTTYPDALGRVWSALSCAEAGEVLLSAAPGVEFVDWGGSDHVGGGSHGSLHANDSYGSLIWAGTGPERADARPQWSLRDVVPMILQHFGLPA